MSDNELDGYAPVDYLVVEFPAGTSNFTGEIAEESDIGQAIGNAVTAYTRSSGKPIWGTTIMVDKA